MEYRENPMFGRKVFFLNPPLFVENFVLDSLRDEEYEAYIIPDYTLAKPVLRQHENAICFIYIDDELSIDGWFNFIKSFEKDDSLKSIFLGVMSIKTKEKEQEKFLMNLSLPGGFVMLDQKPDKVFEQLEGILRINGAKGVRKVIRLDLKDSKDVNGYFAHGSLLYSFRLVDISSVGFAAVIPANTAGIFKKDGILDNVSITMGRYSFVCSVTIYNTKVEGNVCTVIAILSEKTSNQIKRKIHNFVYDTLDMRLKDLMENTGKDFTDYSIKIADPKEKSAEVEDVSEVEELEDIENKDLPDLSL